MNGQVQCSQRSQGWRSADEFITGLRSGVVANTWDVSTELLIEWDARQELPEMLRRDLLSRAVSRRDRLARAYMARHYPHELRQALHACVGAEYSTRREGEADGEH